jgi:hypothetical protein
MIINKYGIVRSKFGETSAVSLGSSYGSYEYGYICLSISKKEAQAQNKAKKRGYELLFDNFNFRFF